MIQVKIFELASQLKERKKREREANVENRFYKKKSKDLLKT